MLGLGPWQLYDLSQTPPLSSRTIVRLWVEGGEGLSINLAGQRGNLLSVRRGFGIPMRSWRGRALFYRHQTPS